MARPVVTEEALRAQLPRPARGQTVRVPAHAQLSPAASDFVHSWGLELVEEHAAPPSAPAHGAPTGSPTGGEGSPTAPAWDRPGTFPVVLTGEPPRCEVCDSPVRGKPDHLTQLDAERFAPKTNPRVALRGRLDTVHAHALLAAARARDRGRPALAQALSTLAAYCREIQSAEYADRAAAPLALAGRDEDAVHRATHDPDGQLGIPHVVPGPEDDELLHWLNLLRCEARETELTGLEAFPPAEASPTRRSVLHALNRLSSGAYLLVLLLRAGELSGAPQPQQEADPTPEGAADGV